VDYDYSPSVWQKLVYAASLGHSFQEAEQHLAKLAELVIVRNRVHRGSVRIGNERLAEREQAVVAFLALPLPEQQKSPTGQVPAVACVQMDGGRIQMRERQPPDEETADEEPDGLWHEVKAGVLLSMTSEVSLVDPCPLLPATFVDPERVSKIAREIKGVAGLSPAAEPEAEELEKPNKDRPGRPKPLVKSVVATCAAVGVFGPLLAAAAHARGFAAAPRKAFVADGSSTNWGVWRKFFSHYTPILDFIHALCYVYAAAMAARPAEVGWAIYRQWTQWVWSGQVDRVIAALEARQSELGLPENSDAKTSPRRQVADTLGYLRNQRSRMKYDEYRKQGLPITSSCIESTIKQINRRMKGTEKFWGDGAEPMLALVADHLSETRPLERFWQARPTRLTGHRSYHTAA
jgi:hypothetical protein